MTVQQNKQEHEKNKKDGDNFKTRLCAAFKGYMEPTCPIQEPVCKARVDKFCNAL